MIANSQKEPANDEVRNALSSIIASKCFENADRLKGFLTYIVEEKIAGRGHLIRGKTVAMDVYGRNPAISGKSENVVRVDARRLRQFLTEYYATEGVNDTLRIWVDNGGYVPRMETLIPVTSAKRLVSNTVIMAGIAVFLLLTGLTVAINSRTSQSNILPAQNQKSMPEKQALREKSAATLQAANLAEQARGFLFPLLEPQRQHIATEMFRQAIKLDPGYFGGYAGAAQTLTTLSKLMSGTQEKEDTLAEAARMLEMAIELNPTHSWTQSAAGWTAFGVGEFDRAFALSSRAIQLDPEDGYTLDFHALISVFTGHFAEARVASDPTRPRKFNKGHLAYRNIFGVANFHLGKYEEGLTSFQRAAETGDPFSPPSLMFQAITYQALGNTEKAAELVNELATTWPKFHPDITLAKFYQHQEHLDQILDKLHAAGWKPQN